GSVAFGGKGGFGVAVAANLVGFSTQTDLVPNLPCSTLAYVRNSQITLGGGTLEVSALDANTGPLPRFVTAAGSLGWGRQQSSTGVGGMVTITIANGQTAAYLQGSRLTDSGQGAPVGLYVHARNNSPVLALGGAVGLGQTAGVGAGIAYNEIASPVRAHLD